MDKFKKLVAIEPVNMLPEDEARLAVYADEVVTYKDIPSCDDEILRRVGDADAVLLSFTSRLTKEVMEQCPNLRYVGMCCSLYSPESEGVASASREYAIMATRASLNTL